MAFTTIAQAADLTVLVKELVLAYEERYYAATGSAGAFANYADVGDDISVPFYLPVFGVGLHQAIEDMVATNLWVRKSQHPFDGDAAIDVYTTATLLSDAGLSASGWRRATEWVPGTVDGTWQNDVSFSYGQPEPGDILGPWIIDDLQKVFNVMLWTKASGDWPAIGSPYTRSGDGQDADCATSRAECDTDYTTSGWVSEDPANDAYIVRRSSGSLGGGDVYFQVRRWKGYPKISTVYVAPGMTYDWECYGYASKSGLTTFRDVDGDGWTEDRYMLLESDTGASAASLTSTVMLGNHDTFPLDIAPTVGCPVSTIDDGVRVAESTWILKWDFDYVL